MWSTVAVVEACSSTARIPRGMPRYMSNGNRVDCSLLSFVDGAVDGLLSAHDQSGHADIIAARPMFCSALVQHRLRALFELGCGLCLKAAGWVTAAALDVPDMEGARCVMLVASFHPLATKERGS